MNPSRKTYLLIIIIMSAAQIGFATHNRAGEITYKQTGPLTIRATITTYTKASSTSADRDSLELFWGDNTSNLVPRSNGEGEIIPGEDIKVNYYTFDHTYPGRATYTLSFVDPNRVNNIQNVNFPNSVDVRFYVETTFTFTSSQFQGYNNSVILLQPPIDFACIGEKFIHNPNAYDPDGDSLSYELIVPLESKGVEVPKYEFPNMAFEPGPDNQISLDPISGDFIWDSPKSPGEYNIAIKINEFRNGILLNSVVRDMQIFVDICTSSPPVIEVIEEICVVAGTRIEIPVKVTDPDNDQLVRLSATGGPFLVEYSKADLTGRFDFTLQPLVEKLIWETKCEHISDIYYQVVFRAQDNSRGTSGLSVLKTLRIKIVGPPPENLTGESINNNIRLEWDYDYKCKETENDYFIGFSVWRKINTNPFVIDSCQEGLDNRSYEIINFLTLENDGIHYTHLDNQNLEKGKIYCYRVLANFAKRTPSGNPYNIIESLASNEICLQLSQDVPLITNVSIRNTSKENGSIQLKWIKPIPDDLDTLQNPGPYTYVLKRSTNILNYFDVPGASFTTNNFSDAVISSFVDTLLDTESQQYFYLVEFYSNNLLYGNAPPASSMFLSLRSSDNQNILDWNEHVSWENYIYRVYRKEGLNYTLLSTDNQSNYVDYEVYNDSTYCYKIESEGTYGLNSTPSPLLNFSQEICGSPLDSVGPCSPVLSVENPCQQLLEGIDIKKFFNTLSWSSILNACINSSDLSSYNIYYSNDINSEFQLIGQRNDSPIINFIHSPNEGISGCYAITSVDSIGNEGPLSNIVCVDNCPIYKLPNTFTPNSDGSNDLFIPIENRFVHSIELKVFNRWGNQVYSTTDPQINWNGKDLANSDVDDGVYYYTCIVFEQNIEGQISQADLLHGHIQIFR